MKKLLLIVIDACASRVLVPAMDSGRLPNIQALARAGSFYSGCRAIFPSITHAATASIATGCYPQEHGIAGAYWYDITENEVVHYAGDFWVILNQGIDEFFEGFVVKLNHQWLQMKTIFQTVERVGFQAGCINHVIFRGDVAHWLDMPRLLSLLPGIPSSETIYGPSILCMGDFIQTIAGSAGEALEATGGLLRRFGFQDDYSADLLLHLVRNRQLPDFTLVYFPDNDDDSHKRGPEAAVETLEHLDTRLHELFAAYGGLEPMLQELCIVLTGDHAQSDIVADKEAAGIRLDEMLSDFSLAQPGKPWTEEDQLVLCPNMRMAQIYFKHRTPAQLESVVNRLMSEARVDQVMWRPGLFEETEKGYHVATADRGRLHFWPGDRGPGTAIDHQGCPWGWSGDLSAVGGQVSADKTITFPDYPNAFERIAGGLDCTSSGHLWATARPGYEFCLAETSIHAGGGSHGSLHALDSIVPLLVAGAPPGIELPTHPRSVDVVPLCLNIFGLKPQFPIGASHISWPGK